MITIIKHTGEILKVPAGELPVSLQQAQLIVGGNVELVYISESNFQPDDFKGGAQMLVNEEGLIKGLPPNLVASGIANRPIVGPALVLTGDDKWD